MDNLQPGRARGRVVRPRVPSVDGMRRVVVTTCALAIAAASSMMGGRASVAVPNVRDVAAAGQRSHYILVPRAGSPRYLVYTARSVDASGAKSSVTELYYRTRRGKPHEIAAVTALSGGYSMAGSILVYNDVSDPNDPDAPLVNYWRDLATGASGTLPQGGYRAAPTGWISFDGEHVVTLTLHKIDGTTTNLGSPYPGGAGYDVIARGTRVVVSALNEGSVGSAKWMDMSNPGVFHTFVSKNHHGPGMARCSSMTTSRVACSVTANNVQSMRLYTTSGKLTVNVTRDYPIGTPQVLDNSIAWIAQAGHRHNLRIATPDGTIRFTDRKFDPPFMATALGGVVVATKSRRHLVLFTSPTRSRTFAQS